MEKQSLPGTAPPPCSIRLINFQIYLYRASYRRRSVTDVSQGKGQTPGLNAPNRKHIKTPSLPRTLFPSQGLPSQWSFALQTRGGHFNAAQASGAAHRAAGRVVRNASRPDDPERVPGRLPLGPPVPPPGGLAWQRTLTQDVDPGAVRAGGGRCVWGV